jgi:transposase
MAEAIGEHLMPVSQVAGIYGVAWHTAHDAFVELADAALGPGDPTDEDSDEDPDSDEDDPDSDSGSHGDGGQGTAPAATRPEPGSGPGDAGQSAADDLPLVTVLGIDDTRRGKRRLQREPAGQGWVQLADAWQTGFVDISGPAGLLGQTPGRAGRDVMRWLSRQPQRWRDAVEVVAIDMSGTYRNGIRTALPHARIAVDPFHVVQLANKMVAQLRRRETAQKYQRRGRTGDPEYRVKRLLMRNVEDLAPTPLAKMWDTLLDAGQPGERILAAYIAKEKIRAVLALSPGHTGITPTDSQIRHRLNDFFTWCATFDDIPEILTFAETVSRWRYEIATAVRTGVSNAKSEGINRVVKLVARTAYGFGNPVNQRRRVRYAATRTSRRNQPQTVPNRRSLPATT